ncbi:hypothetical protein WKV44_06290 [Spirochaetia bacterium 38H-sp]|uniref:Uncharacterized protein n=1 Tax=Rarispira pelagica TaxID=3141764 RepID=A0ABU9UBV6_9SPIR
MANRDRPDKIIRYKNHDRFTEEDKIYGKQTRDNFIKLIDRVLLCLDSLEVDAAVSLARVLNHMGINSDNYLIFLRFLETNNSHVVNALIGRRNPNLLFSHIKPNRYLVKEAFRILARFDRNHINNKVLLALMGILQNTYKLSQFGYSIYPLTVADVYNIGKYINKKKKQEEENNELILDILFDVYLMGIDESNKRIKAVALAANKIRMAYFDNIKRLEDAIPEVLLMMDPKGKEVEPRYINPEEGD